MTTVAVPASGFPATSGNRMRKEAEEELAEYIGAASRASTKERAGKAWDGSVRHFNGYIWKFNRRVQNITLVNDTSEYTLNTTFRAPLRAQYLDASGNTRQALLWINPEERLSFTQEGENTSTAPYAYTIFNHHDEGKVRLVNNLGTPKWPTLRLSHFQLIELAPGPTDRLNVPMDIDEAIFQWAAYQLFRTQDQSTRSDRMRQDAIFFIDQALQNWEGFPDPAFIGSGL